MRIPWLENFQKDPFYIVAVCTPGHTLGQIQYQTIIWGGPWRTDSTKTANRFLFTCTTELVEWCSRINHLQNSGFKLAACWTAASYLWSWLSNTLDWSNLISAAYRFLLHQLWSSQSGAGQSELFSPSQHKSSPVPTEFRQLTASAPSDAWFKSFSVSSSHLVFLRRCCFILKAWLPSALEIRSRMDSRLKALLNIALKIGTNMCNSLKYNS